MGQKLVSSATYWRRRVVVLAAGVAVLGLPVWAVNAAFGGSQAQGPPRSYAGHVAGPGARSPAAGGHSQAAARQIADRGSRPRARPSAAHRGASTVPFRRLGRQTCARGGVLLSLRIYPAPVRARRAGHLRRRRGLRQEPAMPPRPGRHVHFGGGGLRRYAAVGLLKLPAQHRLPGGHAEAGRPGLPPGHLGPEDLTFRLPGPRDCGSGRHLHRRGVQRPAPQPGHDLRAQRPGCGQALTDHTWASRQPPSAQPRTRTFFRRRRIPPKCFSPTRCVVSLAGPPRELTSEVPGEEGQ